MSALEHFNISSQSFQGNVISDVLTSPITFEGAERESGFSEMCNLLRLQYNNDVPKIMSAALSMNKIQCKPPLSEDKVAMIVEDLMSFHAKPLFGSGDSICFADIEPEKVDWLWYPYIPKGRITIVQGYHGEGKTYFETSIAAIVSSGRRFPYSFMTRESAANVILQNGEDGYADTIVPRLMKCGADRNRVHAFNEYAEALQISDLGRLEALFKELKPALFILDPLQQYLGSNVDMHRANEVRPVMAGLSRLASTYNTAVIIVSHMGKADNRAINKSLGSVDIPAIARSILMIGKNRKNQEQKLMIQVKNNLAEFGSPMAFHINNDGFVWEGPVEATEDDILLEGREPKSDSSLAEAIGFIKQVVSDSPIWSSELEELAREEGISKASLKRAKKILGDDWEIEVKKAQVQNRWYICQYGKKADFSDDLSYAKEEVQEEVQLATHEILELLPISQAQQVQQAQEEQQVQEAQEAQEEQLTL